MAHEKQSVSGGLLPVVLLFGLVFLAYFSTLAPGVYGFDSAELATGVFVQGIIHPTGYPLYLLVGKLFSLIPVRDIAFRLNLMSAFFGALTIVLLYIVNLQIGRNRAIAWLAAAVFGFSNYFWQMSVVAEVYTLHTALLAGCLALLLYWRNTGNRYAILLFAFVYGSSLTNHTSGILFAPGLCWIMVTSRWWNWRDWKQLSGTLFHFLLGLVFYLYLPIRYQANPPLNYLTDYYGVDLSTPAGLFWMASGQAYQIFSFGYTLPEIPAQLASFTISLWRNFLGTGVLFGLAGVITSVKKRPDIALGVLFSFLITVLFYVNYRVTDKDTMFLPAYLCWSVFMFEGLLAVGRWMEEIFSSLLSRRGRYIVLILLFLIFLPTPFLNWQWVDMHDADSYSRYAQEVFSSAEPDAVVIAPWSHAVVLEYFQIVKQQRPDIKIVNSSRINVAKYYQQWVKGYTHGEITRTITEENVVLIRDDLRSRPVFAVEYDANLASQFEYLPESIYFRLAEKNKALIQGDFPDGN